MLMYYDSLGYCNWVTDVRNALYSNGFGYVWEAQAVVNEKLFLECYVRELKKQNIVNWRARCEHYKECYLLGNVIKKTFIACQLFSTINKRDVI